MAKTAEIVERAFQIARIRPKPIASSEVHLKVDIICYLWAGIYVSYVRVAFAFPWLDGTPLAYDWDFNPLSSFGRNIWSDIDSAVDKRIAGLRKGQLRRWHVTTQREMHTCFLRTRLRSSPDLSDSSSTLMQS